MANQSKIVQIKNEWFVDVQIAKGCWKNHRVCKSEDEAIRSIENLHKYWGSKFIGVERDASFKPRLARTAGELPC